MTLWNDITTDCCMGPGADACQCDRKEQVVRLFAAGKGNRSLTEQERELLIDEANHCGEGYYARKDLQAMNDQDLASATLNAWSMYVNSNC